MRAKRFTSSFEASFGLRHETELYVLISWEKSEIVPY
jgi:hypothetical protein